MISLRLSGIQGLSKKVVHFGARGNFPKNKKGQAAVTTCLKTIYQMGRGGFEPPTHGFSV